MKSLWVGFAVGMYSITGGGRPGLIVAVSVSVVVAVVVDILIDFDVDAG